MGMNSLYLFAPWYYLDEHMFGFVVPFWHVNSSIFVASLKSLQWNTQVWACGDSQIPVVMPSCRCSLSLPSHLEGFGTNLIGRASNWQETFVLPLSLSFATTLNHFSQGHVSRELVSQVQGRPNAIISLPQLVWYPLHALHLATSYFHLVSLVQQLQCYIANDCTSLCNALQFYLMG